jgi:hypothetical protein
MNAGVRVRWDEIEPNVPRAEHLSIRKALELLADKPDEALTQRGEIPHVKGS